MPTSTPGNPPETKAERERREAAERFRKAKIAAMRERAIAPEPTGYLPGSAKKVEVMACRVANGFSPWHPQDAKRSTD